MPQSEKKILLVDDDRVVLDSLSVFFSKASHLEVVSTASNGQEALEWLKGNFCDIVLSDVHMPVMDGLELLRAFKKLERPSYFVAMTAFDTDETMLRTLAEGGSGYVIKSEPPQSIIDSLSAIIEGGVGLTPKSVARLVDRSILNHPALIEVDSTVSLEDEEIEILLCIRKGFTTDRIAREMNFAEITVKRRILKLMKKFKASSRAELILLSQFKLFTE